MKMLLRKALSIVMGMLLFLSAFSLPPAERAEAAGVTALPDAGTYDRYQKVQLLYEAGATVHYAVYGRAVVPDTSYVAGSLITIEEDVVLSVTCDQSGSIIQRDFAYTINPNILSTYPANGSQNAPVRPTITIDFSREMNEAVLEDENNITITQAGTANEVNGFTASYTSADNRLRITLPADLAAGSTYNITLNNVRDSDGKALQGANSFSFTTAPAAGYSTYGTVSTGSLQYGNGNTVQISGTFTRNGQEISGANLQVRVVNPNGTVAATLGVITGADSSFNTSYTLPADAIPGAWSVRLYDDSSPRQLLDTCAFSVDSVARPKADKPDDPNQTTATYYEPVSVSLSTDTSGATIYYTTDSNISDSDLTDIDVVKSCTLYRGAIVISKTTNLRAVAVKGSAVSPLFECDYIIDDTLGYLTRYPEDNQDEISVNTSVTAEFGRAINQSTLTGNFRLIECDAYNGAEVPAGAVAGTVSYNSVERKATFKPSAPLKPSTWYKAVLDGDIADTKGIKLEVDVEWYFRTNAGHGIEVDGVAYTGNVITVNKNPVPIEVNAAGAASVTINGVQATDQGGGVFTGSAVLKAGNNNVTIVITEIDSAKTTTVVPVNYLDLMQAGAEIAVAIPEKGKLDLFDKQLLMEFPKGTYIYDDNGPVAEQTLNFKIFQSPMADGFPSVSCIFDIQPDIDGADITNKGEITLSITFDKYVSAGSASTLTVLYNPGNDVNDLTWDENLGGKVDAKKRTITVPFNGFGRYVVVNRIWPFTDYATTGWAKIYVEYLWGKGIMKPLPTAGSGQFGLIDGLGQEIPITRGEFAVMMGKALGLNKASYTEYGIFDDMRLTGSIAYAKDQDGTWLAVSSDDYRYIDMLARNGIIHGSLDAYGNQVFNYHNVITREEVAVILSKAFNLKVETDDVKVRAAITKMYADADTSIGDWAEPYVLAASKGYFGGFPDKTFRGKDNFTRPQAAAIIYKAMQKNKML